MDPDITIGSLHRQVKEVFQFPCLVSISCASKAISIQVGFTLKLVGYELDDYNNDEHLREHIEWCQKI